MNQKFNKYAVALILVIALRIFGHLMNGGLFLALFEGAVLVAVAILSHKAEWNKNDTK